MAPPAQTSSIVSASRFVIVIDTIEVAFSELTGIKSEVESVEYISSQLGSGGVGVINHTKQFGKTKPPNVTLKRAVDDSTVIWAWHQLVLEGNLSARRSCALKLQDASGKTLITYVLSEAWPSKVDIAGLKAGASEVVMETVEIVCDRIEMQPS